MLKWDRFNDKLKSRATEELLRFMAMFSSTAAMVCFCGAFVTNSDMTLSLVLLVFMSFFVIFWQVVKRRNTKRWGVAKMQGREVLHIGMDQSKKNAGAVTEEDVEPKKKKKKKPVKKGNFRH